MTPHRHVLLVASALAGCLAWPAAPTSAAAAVPAEIRAHQIASVGRGRSTEAPGHTRIFVRASERSFELDLEASPILVPGARTVFVDATGEHVQPLENNVYRGHLADDPDARVRVALSGSALIGSVTQGEETWYFEPLRVYERSAAPDQVLVYRASDIDASALAPGRCDAGDTTWLGATAPHAILDPSASGPPALAAADSHLRVVELTIVADFQFFQTHGADSAAYIQSIIDHIDLFYRGELHVILQVVQTVVYTSAGVEPFSWTTSPLSLLFSLAGARSSQPTVLGEGDITHLFTGRQLDGSTIGIAFRGAVCDEFSGCGLSHGFSSLDTMILLAGHEMGHSLGAFHDGETGTPCAAEVSGYIMWPRLDWSTRATFSSCSRSTIGPVVAAASCISLAPCGNGVLDPDEECDDGGNERGDCCGVDCQFDNTGAACGDDGNDCTFDICDGAGTCTHPNAEGAYPISCNDGDVCTFDGLCTDGVCNPLGNLRPLRASKVKAVFGIGAEDDALRLRTSFLTFPITESPPTADGVTLRFLDSLGAVLHESIIGASSWVDPNGRGTTFRYLTVGAPAPEAGGALSMLIKYHPRRRGLGKTKINADFGNAELAALAGRSVIGLEVTIGNTTQGVCGTATTLVCTTSAAGLTCR